jgi:hypothetical protein
MKLLLMVLLLAVPCFAQTALSAGLKVNGIGLGASYKSVIAKFGKPTKEVTKKGDECVPDRRKLLTYQGLTFELIEDTKKNFTVISFEVTGAKYDVSGVKLGDTQIAVNRRFGKRSSEETISGSKVWYYEMAADNPGSSNFYFRNGKISKIQTGYEMC